MLRSLFWKPYSHLLIVGDNSGWSTDVDAQDLKNFAEKCGVKAEIIKRAYLNLPQTVHYTSQFSLLLKIYKSKHRLSFDYYHGKPEQGENFQKCFDALKAHQDKIACVRVSNREMEKLLKSVINPDKVMLIHLGIDLNIFKPTSIELRDKARERLNIPKNAVVIGSFVKDGDGWGEGNEPKLIKGPDTFLKVIEKLKYEIPNLWILLSGPSRGYVKKGLDKLGVPYRHEYLKEFKKISELYDAIDLYVITAREEGGPKACLESMAKGVPLVTTRVGQCADLVKHGENAMMTDIDNVDELFRLSLEVIKDKNLQEKLRLEGFKTAEANSHKNQLPLWSRYFDSLIK